MKERVPITLCLLLICLSMSHCQTTEEEATTSNVAEFIPGIPFGMDVVIAGGSAACAILVMCCVLCCVCFMRSRRKSRPKLGREDSLNMLDYPGPPSFTGTRSNQHLSSIATTSTTAARRSRTNLARTSASQVRQSNRRISGGDKSDDEVIAAMAPEVTVPQYQAAPHVLGGLQSSTEFIDATEQQPEDKVVCTSDPAPLPEIDLTPRKPSTNKNTPYNGGTIYSPAPKLSTLASRLQTGQAQTLSRAPKFNANSRRSSSRKSHRRSKRRSVQDSRYGRIPMNEENRSRPVQRSGAYANRPMPNFTTYRPQGGGEAAPVDEVIDMI